MPPPSGQHSSPAPPWTPRTVHVKTFIIIRPGQPADSRRESVVASIDNPRWTPDATSNAVTCKVAFDTGAGDAAYEFNMCSDVLLPEFKKIGIFPVSVEPIEVVGAVGGARLLLSEAVRLEVSVPQQRGRIKCSLLVYINRDPCDKTNLITIGLFPY